MFHASAIFQVIDGVLMFLIHLIHIITIYIYIKAEIDLNQNLATQVEKRSISRKRNLDVFKCTHPNEHQENHKKKREYANKNYASKKDTPEHKEMLEQLRKSYALKKICPEHKIKLLQKQKDYAALKASNNSDIDKRIKKFKELIMEGPYYICVVCNRCLYKRSVITFKIEKYESLNSTFYFSHILSFDSSQYICITCNRKLKSKKDQTPYQAVCNKLELYNFSQNLSDINRLEKVLIAKRLLFKKVVIMPKGNSPKIKGAICNVPVDSDGVCNVLPCPACSDGLLLLKLKRKLIYCSHVYFEPIRPHLVLELLNFLKENNFLYNNVTIELDQDVC